MALGALGAPGCGGGGGGGATDGGTDGGGGGTFANLPVTDACTATDTGGNCTSHVATDYSCSPSAPAAGSSFTFTLHIADFADPTMAAQSVCVNVYTDNVIPQSDSCGSTMTDSNGNITVTDTDGGWFAYRIFGDSNVLGLVQKNIEDPGPTDVPGVGGCTAPCILGDSVSNGTAAAIQLVLGLQQNSAAAIFAGTVMDCTGNPVRGAAVRVVRGGAIVPAETTATGAHYEYFDGTGMIPVAGQDSTNSDGLYIGVNIPVSQPGEQVLLIACGKPVAGQPQLLGCEETRSFANTVNVVDLGPVRSDAPAGCAQAASLCMQ